MNIWINSCHAAWEYDLAKILIYCRHRVSGLFDVGSKQRPKLPGVTDVDPPSEIHEKAKTRDLTYADIGKPDLIITHQTPDFPERAASYALMGKPVIVTIFGQGSAMDHMKLARYANEVKHLYIVVYALKELQIYRHLGVPPNQLHMIRFGKPIEEMRPQHWTGEDPHCFIPCNSIHLRGVGCSWVMIKELMDRGVPVKVGGRATEEVGGLGELTYAEYCTQMRKAACYFHVGTVPAPYTLTFVEAACSGTPIIANNNKCGILEERFDVPLVEGVDAAETAIRNMLMDPAARQEAHRRSIFLSQMHFNGGVIRKQWGALLESIESL